MFVYVWEKQRHEHIPITTLNEFLITGRANKLVNDLRNEGYHNYSASLDDNGLADARPLSLPRLNNCDNLHFFGH